MSAPNRVTNRLTAKNSGWLKAFIQLSMWVIKANTFSFPFVTSSAANVRDLVSVSYKVKLLLRVISKLEGQSLH